MPILEILSNQTPKDLEFFSQRLSPIFAECICKPEKLCTVIFRKVDSFSLSGSDAPGFLARVDSIGHIDKEYNTKMAATIGSEIQKELGISSRRGYFVFTNLNADNILLCE